MLLNYLESLEELKISHFIRIIYDDLVNERKGIRELHVYKND